MSTIYQWRTHANRKTTTSQQEQTRSSLGGTNGRTVPDYGILPVKCAAFLGPGSSDERPTTSFLASFRKIAHAAGELASRFRTESGLAFRQLFPISNRLSLTSQDNLVKLTHTPASICTHPTVSSRARRFVFACSNPIILVRGNLCSFAEATPGGNRCSRNDLRQPNHRASLHSPSIPLQLMKFEETVRSVRFRGTDLALFRKMHLSASSGGMDCSGRGCAG